MAGPSADAAECVEALLLDERVVDRTEGVRLTLGQVSKHPDNPLFKADRPWENSLNNLYPNVIYGQSDQLYKMWYKCVLADEDVIAKLDPVRTVHARTGPVHFR